MNIFANIKISTQVIFLSLLSLAIVLFVSITETIESLEQRRSMHSLKVAIEYVNALSPLLPSLAEEQKYTVFYVFAPGQDTALVASKKAQMLEKRKLAEADEEEFERFLEANRAKLSVHPKMKAELEVVDMRLNELDYVRKVADKKLPSSDEFKHLYSDGTIWTSGDIAKARMSLVKSISRVAEIASTDKQLSRSASSLFFLLTTATVSEELHHLISLGQVQVLNTFQYGQLVSHIMRESQFREIFTRYASDEIMNLYNNLLIDTGVMAMADKAYWQSFGMSELAGKSTLQLSADTDWQTPSEQVPVAFQTLQQAVLEEMTNVMNARMDYANSHLKSSILWAVAFTGVIIMASYIIRRNIAKPLQKMVQSFTELSESKNMAIRLQKHGSNEFSELSEAFNNLVLSFNQALVGIQQHAGSMNASNTQTAETMRQALALSERQMEATDSISVAINQMTASIREVSSMTQQTASAVQKANEISVSSVSAAQKAQELMQNLTGELGSTSESIQSFNQEANQIGGILNVIQGIAEQTNLLALNASIESARAGESGRGFAIVADEVRELSKRTQEATRQIREQVDSLLKGANATTTRTLELQNEGTKAVEIAIQTISEFSILNQELDGITSMAAQIATASEEQSAVSEEINERICAIKTDSEHLSEYATTTKGMTEAAEQEGHQLQEHIDRFQTTNT